jgi:hypothetical protein
LSQEYVFVDRTSTITLHTTWPLTSTNNGDLFEIDLSFQTRSPNAHIASVIATIDREQVDMEDCKLLLMNRLISTLFYLDQNSTEHQHALPQWSITVYIEMNRLVSRLYINNTFAAMTEYKEHGLYNNNKQQFKQ